MTQGAPDYGSAPGVGVMQAVVVDKPYRFTPPYAGRGWPRFLQWITRWRLRRQFGVDRVECHGLDHLRQSLDAGHGILLAPNHCRPCDPLVVNETCRRVGALPLTMASSHLFANGGLQAWFAHRAGAFSIYREGLDRQALNTAIEILDRAERPLVVFPEGVIGRHNDRLNSLQDGTAFMARSAAKKRAERHPAGQVVIHPIALRYHFRGNLEAALLPVLDEIEQRLSWRPKRELRIVQRIFVIGEALLALKEIEFLGATQSGSFFERINRLIDSLLVPLEEEWLKGRRDTTVVGRVKKLRMAILPDLVAGELPQAERDRRWKQLGEMYFAQQLACYPPDYVRSNPSPQRIVETVERLEEDLTDTARIHSPMTAFVRIGPAIPVSSTKDRSGEGDPVMSALEKTLSELLGIAPTPFSAEHNPLAIVT